MNRRAIIVCAFIIGVVGWGLYNAYGAELTTIISPIVTPIVTTLTSIGTQIYTAWNGLPDTIRGIILAGVPTLFMLFFAWTKNRAMQQLQTVQQQAQLQGSQLQTSITDNQQMSEILSTQDQLLQRSRDALSAVTTTQSTLLSGVQNVNTNLSKSVEQMQIERDSAVRDALALQREVEEFRKKYIVA